MLTGDRETKAAYYYVHNLLRLRLWAKRLQTGTPESLSFKGIMDKASLPVDQTLADEGKKQVQEIDNVLSQARFVAVRDDFVNSKKQNGRQPVWYSPLGVKHLREMATAVNKEASYLMLYTSGSEVMHASNYGQHIRIANKRITFYSIRHPEEFSSTVRFTATIAIDIFMRILHEYREGEFQRFCQKYVEKWQHTFMNIPRLKIDEQSGWPT
jgi:hypothetical protein